MSRLLFFCLILLTWPRLGLAQRSDSWRLSAIIGLNSFSHAASRPGQGAGSQVRMASASAFGASIARHLAGWDLRTSADLLSSNVQVQDGEVLVEALAPALSRLRVALVAAHPVASLGKAVLTAGAGGALDFWSAPAEGIRTRGGMVARLSLCVDAGRFAIENSLSGSLSPSVFAPRDLPDGFRPNWFRTVSAGFEVRFGL